MKKYFGILFVALAAMSLGACGGDEDFDSSNDELSQKSRSAEEEEDYMSSTNRRYNNLEDSLKNDTAWVSGPSYKDFCGLSETDFRIDRREQAIEVTSEKPFCIHSITTRNKAHKEFFEAWQWYYYDWCEEFQKKANPDEYVKSGEQDFIRFERDNQCHLRIIVSENDGGILRDCFIGTYNPRDIIDTELHYNYGEIRIFQEAE